MLLCVVVFLAQLPNCCYKLTSIFFFLVIWKFFFHRFLFSRKSCTFYVFQKLREEHLIWMPGASPSNIEDWIARPQDKKCLRVAPSSTAHNRGTQPSSGAWTPTLVQEPSLVSWLHQLATYGEKLERYETQRHAFGGSAQSQVGSHGERLQQLQQPSLHELPRFPRF